MIRQIVIAILLVIAFVIAGVQRGFAAEPAMADYTKYPVFIADAVKPNILIILDNSGSMNFCAYGDWPGDGRLVTTHPYSGSGYTGTVETRVSDDRDDAEERVSDGRCYSDSDDLDLAWEYYDYDNMLIGIRFKEVEIPQGATITSAYIQFNAYRTSSNAVAGAKLRFHVEDVDDAQTFSSGTNSNISNRTYTTAYVDWEVPKWEEDDNYQSPDISSIVREIVVNRSGWSSGNAMVFKISSTSGEDARRQAKDYSDDNPSEAPLLHIEYSGAETTSYYGYFNPDKTYDYDGNKFVIKSSGPYSDGPWEGNWLNWLSMRRIDCARKVLVGGLATPRTGGGNTTLHGDNHSAQSSRYYKKNFNNSQSAMDQGITVSPYTDQNEDYCYGVRSGYIYADDDSSPFSGYIKRYNIKVQKDESEEPDEFLDGNITGVLQRLEDKARWGLAFYNSSDGAHVASRVTSGNINDVVTRIENKKADTWTPLAEAFYEMVRYYQQVTPYYYNSDYTRNNQFDPYYWEDEQEFVSCGKSFILLITDGESTQDKNIPSSLRDYDGDGNDSTFYSSNGSNYLDDVALWAHTNDLRSDLEGTQDIILYTVFAFGSGSELLKDAAKNGGFVDKDGDNRPSSTDEWDEDGDGNPDAYFQAPSGYELEQQLLDAITAILKRAASGTAVSVLATSGEGEGSLVQAYFKPTVTEGTEEIKWVGYLQSLWVDEQGNMREDTNSNRALNIGTDKVIRYDTDDNGNTKVKRYTVSDSDPYPDVENDTPEGTYEIDEISPVWDAAEALSDTSPDDRTIFTFIDKNNDQVVDEPANDIDPFDNDGEVIKFHTDSASNIKPYLGVQDNSTWSYLGSTHDYRATNLIKFIRGYDSNFSGSPDMRSRTIDNKVWKLGDIVSSTPISIAKPPDNYGLIYGDQTYGSYYNKYKDRETVIYVGANDGMLHAFTSWKYNAADKKFEDPGHAVGESIGNEIWAYIPQSLLPHLKWLPDEDYTHVYYVDLKPKIVDAKIFGSGDTHPNGWGTVLIGGLNIGGKGISATDDFDYNSGTDDTTRDFSSSYFAIDVTNPREPKLLWEKQYSDLGLTTSIPAVLKVEDKWFAVFGSGPTDYDGNSTEYGHIFIVDLLTGTPYQSGTNDWLFETDENNAFMNSPVTLDKGLNYSVDAIYIGETYKQGNNWKGAMYRVAIPWVGTGAYGSTATGNYYVDDPTYGSNPWSLSSLFSSPGPITATAALSIDSLDNAWAYFGTGRYFSDDDKLNTDTQYFFGIKDPFFNSDSSDYHDYTMTTLTTSDLFDADPYTVTDDGWVLKNNATYKQFEDFVSEVRGYDGWQRTLTASGERSLSKPSVLGGIVFAPTFAPNADICSFGGESYLYGLYYETGTAYTDAVFEDGTEQATDAGGDTRTKIKDKFDLGLGMASSLGIHVGKEEGAKGFIQQSTGAVMDLTLTPAFNIKSGLVGWRER